MQVVESIKESIDTGEYVYGKKMPTIKDLATALNVSAMTVKKALDVLSKSGYIDRRQGSGIYVKMNTDKINKRIPLVGNSSRFPKSGLKTQVIHFDIIHPTKEIAEILSIDTEDFIYDIERVRIFKGRPVIMEYVKMPINVVPGVTKQILEGSIYAYIKGTLNKRISSSDFVVAGVRPEADDKKYLNLDENDFLMQIIQTVYFDDGTAFEYSVDKHIPEEFEYRGVETVIG